ncbi:MAG: regulatory protein RecX [Coriobacteriia bacterium]|nr:regulatory protein RecX [Coriobacteriia bacterium]MBN2840928.1 regulatory protein RecX [Coriobacteriia bacterium]
MEPRNEVTAIRTRRGSKRREVELDGSPWRAVPKPVLARLGISVGDLVDADQVTDRIQELEPTAARERTMRLLEYRDRSEAEMRARLTGDGYSEATTDDTVIWLLDTGLLDDDRFAEQLARSLVVGRRYGRTRSLRHLQQAGVPADVARRALDALAPEEDERERALVLARSLFRHGDSVERLASRLVRRGFTPSDSLAVAHSVIPQEGVDDDDRSDDC